MRLRPRLDRLSPHPGRDAAVSPDLFFVLIGFWELVLKLDQFVSLLPRTPGGNCSRIRGRSAGPSLSGRCERDERSHPPEVLHPWPFSFGTYKLSRRLG